MKIYGEILPRRLFLGTAGYPSFELLRLAVEAAQSCVITVSIKKGNYYVSDQGFIAWLKKMSHIRILPNTAGCYTVADAVMMAEISREIYETDWIKLEIIGDKHNLQPHPWYTVEAAEILSKKGFCVFPYCTDDICMGQGLQAAGCEVLMPWASPIGSCMGLVNLQALIQYRQRFSESFLIVDAGIGRPSDAMKIMELGYDGILVNSAIAKSINPEKMAKAFYYAVLAGEHGQKAGFAAQYDFARTSTILEETPFFA